MNSCATSRAAVVVATLVVLCALAPTANAQTNIDDYTQYTYAVRAAGIGTVADYPVSRTFQAPITSLKLYIIGGQADDVGYVGSRQVTTFPSRCAGVGAVTAVQDVTDQVTINGSTASFLLRAVENCCCWTGWGSATEGGRANAQFHWVVTVGGQSCPTPPLTPITDPLAQSFESGQTVDTDGLTSAMQTALACLRAAAAAHGGSVTVTSAFRPPAYQAHMLEVWNDWDDLRNSRDPNCATRRTEVQTEWNRHRMRHRPAVNSKHSRGEAFDANWSLPHGPSVDALAADCDLERIVSNDPVHFTHK